MHMKLGLTIGAALVLLAGIGVVAGDEDEREGWGWRAWREARRDVAPVQNERYAAECGACHFAYQPGLLPARSWEKLMSNLSGHFGDNAELEPVDAKAITRYLVENAADRTSYRRSAGIARSIPAGETLLRITETPYFVRKHREIPRRMVESNPKVGSFSNCAACHTRADEGAYNEHEVLIPGVGRWED